jgi:hypothetical protein
MAIPYLNVQFTHVRSDGGAAETMAYLGRGRVLDVRLAQQYDFQHLGGDLVHSEIMRTEGVSKAFEDPEHLANSIDAAEVYRLRGDIDDRLRKTQNGAVVVLALPPASEMTLTEAIEFTKRIALLIGGGRRLAIHIAIHDPAMMHPGARNRHAHLFFPRREIEYDELAGPAIRDLFARPMQIFASDRAVTVEGNRWPDFHRRQQQIFFAEQGLELIVDPIAPFPGRRWRSDAQLDDPRIQRGLSRTRRLNVQAIHGEAAWLIGKLLRGQATIRIAELQRLLDRFIDREGTRLTLLEAILSRPDIVTLAADPVAAKPRFVTTAAVHDCVQDACELVHRAAIAEEPGTIYAITAASHTAAIERFDALLGRINCDRPLLLGNNHSECQELSNAIRRSQPKVTTIKRGLSDLKKLASPERPNATGRAPNGLIIVSRAESVEDQILARLIVAAHEQGAPIVLLHDQSKQNGVVSHRLAAYAADRLAALENVNEETFAEAVERFLRAGLVSPAIRLMAQHHDIVFKTIEDLPSEAASFDFLVCNDLRRVNDWNEKIRSLRLRQGTLQVPTKLGHPLKPVWLTKGERIVFTRDDRSVRPPTIRAGEIAQIVEIDTPRNAIHVALSDGGIEVIELQRFAHFRPAHAVLIREARNIDREHSLRIEVSDIHHVWATLVLAVQHRRAALVIDPCVAIDIPSLIVATQRSMPAALPHQLTLRRDPNAEMIAILKGEDPAPVLSGGFEPEPMPEPTQSEIVPADERIASRPETFEPERFPEPAPSVKVTLQPTLPMHERVRAVLDLNPHTRRGLERLREKLSNDNPDRDADAKHVLSLWGEDSPMAAIVRLLQGRSSVEVNPMNDLDLPPEIEQLSPREWDDWELERLKIDLSALQFGFANWTFVPKSSRPASLRRRDGSKDGAGRRKRSGGISHDGSGPKS